MQLPTQKPHSIILPTIIFVLALCAPNFLKAQAIAAVPVCATPPSGLTHWWPGENNANDIVDGANGTLQNGTTFAAGMVGQAFSFDGADDYVSFGNTTGNFGTNDFTIEYWLKTSTTRIEPVIGKWGNCGFSSFWDMRLSGGKLQLEMASDASGNDVNSRPSNRSVNDGVFHHIAVVRHTTTISMYIDGVLDYTNSTPGITILNNSANLLAGSGPCIGVDGTQPYTGLLDDISIYSRALTLAEIQSIYNAASAGKCPPPPPPVCVPPPSGLVSWWQANNSALDRADSNHGTLIGNAGYAAGRVGQAFTFDGSGDAVFIGNPANLQLQNLTIEGWVKRSSDTQVSANSIYGEIVGYGPGGYVLGFRQDGSLFLSKNTISDVRSVGTITDMAWHHVAVTKNGSTVVFYLDGVAEPAITYNTTFEFTTDLRIGAVNSGVEASFLGMIDELAIYNRALSTTEIQSIYNADSAGKCPPPPTCVPTPAGLVNWWPGESNATDVVGGVNGTLNGGLGFAAGEVGQTFSFDGVDDYVSFGNTTGNFGTNDFSIEFWIKTTSTRMESTIEKWASCSFSSFWEIRMRGAGAWGAAGRLEMAMVSDAAGHDVNSILCNRAINDGIFHHVAVVRQATNLSFYIDGAFDVQGSTAGITILNNAANLTAGRSVCVGVDGTSSFTGQMDEISIYNRALTLAEIQSIYNAASAGKCPLPPPPPPPPAIGPFINGSFEMPVVSLGGHAQPSGSTNITGWILGGAGTVSFINGPAGGVVNPVDGAQQLDFDSGDSPANATLSQTFLTIIGQLYAVSFNVGRFGPGGATMSLLAEVKSGTGAVLGSLSAVAPNTQSYGAAQSFTFTATTTNSTLTFTDTSSATVAVDVLLDNVSVTPGSGTCVAPPPGLTHWWPGESTAQDVVGGVNGTLNGGLGFGAGEVGQAFNFDGVNDYVTFGNTVGNFDTNDFTIDFWIKTAAARIESVIEKWPTCGISSMWDIRIGGNGIGRLESEMFSDAAGNNHNVIVSGRTINDGVFHHVAYVRKG
ncbi:MAG: DUF642 domain-containing protein, partial [Verrucomicrobia bacterium]|nr:DUF642 domain-containing protein [Verrucomicrobiota bacterium]